MTRPTRCADLLGDVETPVRLIPYLAPIDADVAAVLARFRGSHDSAERRFLAAAVLLSLPSATPLLPTGMGREDPRMLSAWLARGSGRCAI